jgi:hypothetical protein
VELERAQWADRVESPESSETLERAKEEENTVERERRGNVCLDPLNQDAILQASEDGMMIKLTAKTRHGKNRIKQFGDTWQVIRHSPQVACLDGAQGILIEPADGNHSGRRWIELANDRDFHWETV